ncbi:MAG: UvrD-helicase domain-containing protein [Dehalococcoidia bacterium]|nr:UvrD-helicase domain-containing protein [Dehalococcoidia bacterium]
MTAPGIDYRLEDERTRRKICEELDQTLFVEAGAGTGKTRALVDRVVALVCLGQTRIDRIVAITFTERAAAELRDRIRSELEGAVGRDPERGEAQRALTALDRAQISTIHSFAQALLRSFAAEAGVDPAFEVHDQVLAERRLQERWRSYLEELGNDPDAVRIVDRALGLGLTTYQLERLAADLTSRGEVASLLEERPLRAPTPFWPDLEEMHQRLRQLPLSTVPEGDPLRLRVEPVRALLADLLRAGDEREAVLATGASLLERRFGVGNTATWGPAIREVRDAAQAVCGRLSELLAVCRSEALADLMPLVVGFVRRDERARGREGLLTFDDLILRVRDLLATSRHAVTALRERYDALLIDEFQDTDPLQVDIALAFARAPETGRLEPGRLFLVGDPKQSIYRFRRADMAVYSRTQSLITESGGRPYALALNKRSWSRVLGWVNPVFERLIGDGADPGVQPAYHAIHAERPDTDLRGPGVARIGDAIDGAGAREARRLEAVALAAQCRGVLDEGWQVMERDGSVRAATFRDIAVLIPRRLILTPLERALAEAGVPYRVEGGSLIYRTQEVRDLINCLTAIDDPADEVATAGALRSAAYACSDVDLARHRAAGGRFNYLAADLDGRPGPVAEALRDLRRWHGRRHETSLAALVERFVAERGQVETGILDQGDRNSFRRMRFVAEQARAFEAAGLESLRAFVAWMERRAGEAILDNEGGGVDDDEDAVRILTVHGAKGLEFPIVFLAGLGAAPNSRTNVYTVDHAGERVAVCIGPKSRNARFDLGPVDELTRREKAHDEAEFARLLYVGATRARDHLVVSLYHTARAGQSGARRLIGAGARDHCPEHMPAAVARRPAGEPFAGLAVDAPDIEEGEFEAARALLVEASRRVRYTSATALGAAAKEEATDASEPWARGRGGTRLGRAVHAAIQSLPLDAEDDLIAAFARAQAVAEAIPHRAAEVGRLVRWVLRESGAAQRARAAERALREVPFAMQVDGKVLEGFVDLVIETADGIEIVDWKTDRVEAAEVAERLQGYELQAGLYVLGLEAATGRRVRAVTYVFASARREVSPGDPEVLAEAARRRLASSS